jgi:segment polarity protein dishevelled
MEETKVIYYIDDEDTPYMMKIMESPSKVTLKDFKAQLNRPYKKFYFRSTDDDIGTVKEEIANDDMSLPNVNGRVVCWVVTGEQGSQSGSDTGGSKEKLDSTKERDGDDVSLVSRSSRRYKPHRHHHRSHGHLRQRRRHRVGNAGDESAMSGTDFDTQTEFTSASYATTDLESVADTSDTVSRVSASTLTSLQPRRKVLTKHRPKRSMSMSTMTATSVTSASMQIVQVTLNMDTVNFLGISIVGQTSEDGGGGIFVGSVMKGGAVAADGRIEPGDMLLEVNEISFENMSNDDAVKALREIVQQPGPITLTVAKCWEPEPVVPHFEPRMEPIRPIDPSAWVQQTNQMHGLSSFCLSLSIPSHSLLCDS